MRTTETFGLSKEIKVLILDGLERKLSLNINLLSFKINSIIFLESMSIKTYQYIAFIIFTLVGISQSIFNDNSCKATVTSCKTYDSSAKCT